MSSEKKTQKRRTALFVSCILIGASFFADLKLPLGYAGGMPYLLPVVITGLWVGPFALVSVAIACSCLTFAGFLLSGEIGVERGIVVLNRVGAVLGIWGAAFGVTLYKKKEALVLRALTESVSAQRAQRESEARYSTMIDTAVEGIITVGQDELIQSMNPSAQSIFGYTAEEVIGMNIRTLLSLRDTPKLTLQDYQGKNHEITGCHKSEASLTLQLFASRMQFDTETVYSLFLRDLTEERNLERQLHQSQKMEVIGSLTGGVAHDVNNLLMGINGCTDAALAKLAPEHEARKYLEEIKTSVTSGASIARQLLGVIHPTTISEKKHVELNELVLSSEKMLRRLLPDNIRLVTDLCKDATGVFCQAGPCEQILLNLVVNASEAMAEGGELTVATSVIEQGADQRTVLLRVSDTGIGMDDATQKRVFEPFFTTKKSGTGLGLATIHRIVSQLGGTITVQSVLGKGTTFKVHLPHHRQDQTAIETPRTYEEQQPRHLANPKPATILFVEDHKASRLACRELLVDMGYRVIDAANGADALRAAREHPGAIELILTDFGLPDMSGAQLVSRVRELRSVRGVIYLSGRNREDSELKSALQQSDERVQTAFIPKPVDFDDVERTVRRLIRAAAS